MTTIISHNLNNQPTQITAPQITITVENPPQHLVQLPSGAIFNTKVVANLAEGFTKLDSIFGQLTIRTSIVLPENSSLELQLLRFQPQLQLLLKKINNLEIRDPSPAKSINQTVKTVIQSTLVSQKIPVNQTRPEPNATKLDIGAQIQATLLRPIEKTTENLLQPSNGKYSNAEQNSVSATPKSQAPSKIESKQDPQVKLAVGDDLISKALSKTYRRLKIFGDKASSIARLTTEGGGSYILKTIQSILENKKISNPRDTAPLKAGTKLVLNFLGTNHNSIQNSKISMVSHNTINGVVVATTPTGQPIINTPLGMMAVETRVPLKTGLNLQLEIIPEKITVPTSSSPVTRFEMIFQSKEWFNLIDAIHEIDLVAPQVAKTFTTTTLPQPNTQLTSNILFFLNALKGGDIRSWIGNTAATLLGQINPELLAQLDEDFALLNRVNIEPQANEWRTAVIPFLTTMGLEQFHLHTQGQLNQEYNKNDDNNSRFIIDISLSRLGRLQLDGFLRKKRKRLDLVVRTQQALPKTIRIEISKIYKDFSEISEIIGQITFQVNQHFVEIPMPQLVDHSTKGVVI